MSYLDMSARELLVSLFQAQPHPPAREWAMLEKAIEIWANLPTGSVQVKIVPGRQGEQYHVYCGTVGAARKVQQNFGGTRTGVVLTGYIVDLTK